MLRLMLLQRSEVLAQQGRLPVEAVLLLWLVAGLELGTESGSVLSEEEARLLCKQIAAVDLPLPWVAACTEPRARTILKMLHTNMLVVAAHISHHLCGEESVQFLHVLPLINSLDFRGENDTAANMTNLLPHDAAVFRQDRATAYEAELQLIGERRLWQKDSQYRKIDARYGIVEWAAMTVPNRAPSVIALVEQLAALDESHALTTALDKIFSGGRKEDIMPLFLHGIEDLRAMISAIGRAKMAGVCSHIDCIMAWQIRHVDCRSEQTVARLLEGMAAILTDEITPSGMFTNCTEATLDRQFDGTDFAKGPMQMLCAVFRGHTLHTTPAELAEAKELVQEHLERKFWGFSLQVCCDLLRHGSSLIAQIPCLQKTVEHEVRQKLRGLARREKFEVIRKIPFAELNAALANLVRLAVEDETVRASQKAEVEQLDVLKSIQDVVAGCQQASFGSLESVQPWTDNLPFGLSLGGIASQTALQFLDSSHRINDLHRLLGQKFPLHFTNWYRSLSASAVRELFTRPEASQLCESVRLLRCAVQSELDALRTKKVTMRRQEEIFSALFRSKAVELFAPPLCDEADEFVEVLEAEVKCDVANLREIY
jgi:uncharacterized protein (DUF1810 family)